MNALIERVFSFASPRWRRQRSDRISSTVRALSRSMSRDQFNTVLLMCSDPRDVLTVAASVLDTSIDQILPEVASILEIAHSSFVAPIPRELWCGLQQSFDLFHCEQYGFLPVVAEGKISAIMCVNPEVIDDCLPDFEALPRILVTWPMMRRAIESTRISLQTPVKSGLESTERQLLSALLRETIKHEGQSLTLDTTKNPPEYVIALGTRSARGTFASSQSIAVRRLSAAIIAGQVPVMPSGDPESDLFRNWGVKLVAKDVFQFRSKDSESGTIIQFPTIDVPVVQAPADRMFVLIVEDQGIYASVLATFLSKLGLTAHHCSNGLQALTWLNQTRSLPALVISDMHMPEMSGEAFLAALKADSRFNAVPVLMCTSDESSDTEAALISQGAHAVISKNQEPKVLAAYIRRIIPEPSKSVVEEG